MGYLNWDCPFWVVDIHKMTILYCNFLNFTQNFLIVELWIISTFKVQCPAANFRIVSLLKQLVDIVKHFEVFGFKTLFNRQYFVAKSCYFSVVFMNILHYRLNNFMRVYLWILWVYLYENHALNNLRLTFTLVYRENNSLFYVFFVIFNSFYKLIYFPCSFNYFFMSYPSKSSYIFSTY